ncbi:Protein of unknown function [Bacillus thuringiensis]|uniref:Uncharacterized protein n=2 Tax=Bacillus cereus group TaxID=86661 RepID=A0A1C4EEL9_BACTU|nr:Protein of unknown function [Bacillus thuringiensis]SCC47096.1 Protein of unknown function [Bacillus wiedmannii]
MNVPEPPYTAVSGLLPV